MKYATYQSYKFSGTDWIGEIPSNWECRRLKDCGALLAGAGFPHEYQGLEDEELPFYKVGDLSQSLDGRHMASGEHTISRKTAYTLRAKVIPPSAIVYAKIGAALLLNRRRITVKDCCIDNNMTAFIPNQRRLSTAWAHYWLSTLDFGEFTNPGAVPSLSEGYQATLPIVLPPLEEQQTIARFLDAKTAQIDALVAQKRQLIDKLKEKRQALIARTVTRGLPPEAAKAAGLEPNPDMKDSGVDWLGAVPARWKIKAIKWATPVQRGASPRPIDDPSYFDDDGEYAWVRISDVTTAGMYLDATEQLLSDLGSSLSVKMQPGSLFLSIAGTVGKPCIANIKCCIHDGFVYFPRWKGDSRFLFYVFASGEPYKGLGKMGTQLNLNTDTVGSIVIGIPDAAEQRLIADYLDRTTAELDSMTTAVEAAIDRLVEYRQAVITSAVTGKIDVRELA